MVIYNVTIKVEHNSADAWVQWMHNEHIPDLMQTGLFTNALLFKLLDQDESDGLTYAAQYHCNSINEYNKYIDEYAMTMREKGMKAFGGKFVAFRTVMQRVEA